ncbi:hypothetical protein HMPREF0507_02006 [Lactobacillus crispatus MV-1A-US]|nr:hypothetical protein HMPREF0507_02006 [Lactobacillus crispatus MV-1A-US]MBI1716158.1 hypothetical protein [Lactobacillus crispatus]CPR87553.1 Uncharacterised protein [Chlamydia trachomatis]DAJ15649.1 MAG TPA: hypothetical protein [Siphoviridae sp. ctBfm1]
MCSGSLRRWWYPMKHRKRKRVSIEARYNRKTAIINLITAVVALIASIVGLLH